MKYCAKCGTEIPDSETLCGKCKFEKYILEKNSKSASEPARYTNSAPDTGTGNSRPGRFCSYCGSPVETTAKFCSNCGNVLGVAEEKAQFPKEESPVIEPARYTDSVPDPDIEYSEPDRFCNNCGLPVEEDDAFCVNCGNSLDDTEEKEGMGIHHILTWVKKKINAKVIIALVAVAAILVALISFSGPRAAANKFIKAMKNGEARAILSLVHEDIWDEMDVEPDDFIGNLEYVFDELEGCKWKIEKIKEYERGDDAYEELKDWYDDELDLKVTGVAKVTVSVEKDDEIGYMQLFFVKIKDKWYLQPTPSSWW